AYHLTLRLFLRDSRAIYMRALLFIAAHQAFVRHDLHQFQDSRVADRLGLAERIVDVANSGSTPLPQHAQNCEFAVSGTRLVDFGHRPDHTTKPFVMSTKMFVAVAWDAGQLGVVGRLAY